MSANRSLQTLSLAALMWLVALLLSACESETKTTATGTMATDGPVVEKPAQQFFDYRLIESNAGVRQWVLESAEMQKFTGQRDAILIDVHQELDP